MSTTATTDLPRRRPSGAWLGAAPSLCRIVGGEPHKPPHLLVCVPERIGSGAGPLLGQPLVRLVVALLGPTRVRAVLHLGHSRLELAPELRIPLLLEPRLVVRAQATVLFGRLLLIW